MELRTFPGETSRASSRPCRNPAHGDRSVKRRCAPTRWLVPFMWVSIVTGFAPDVRADPLREVRGSGDVYVTPAMALAWGVLGSASESDTQVVIRIDADPLPYALLTVTGVDPFSQASRGLLPPTRLRGGFEFLSPRLSFAKYPRTELRFYRNAAAVATNAPTLMVSYFGIPDTTPEFESEARLEASLGERIVNARKELRGTGR